MVLVSNERAGLPLSIHIKKCLNGQAEGKLQTKELAVVKITIPGKVFIVPPLQEIAECLQQNAKSEKATAFLIWKALLFSAVALTTISEHLHHRIYFTVANILQSPVSGMQIFGNDHFVVKSIVLSPR